MKLYNTVACSYMFIQFAVVARVRNCTKIGRSEVIRTIASTVGKDHKVDLDNPELSIIVEICQVQKQ